MTMDFDIRGDFPHLSAGVAEPIGQAVQGEPVARLAAAFSEEQRDLVRIICNNLARLRDELSDDDPRRVLVSSTLRVAQASAALTLEWPRIQVCPAEPDDVDHESRLDLSAFTPRQLTVLDLLAQGLSTKEIARRLGLGLGTVKVHLTGIYRIMNPRNRVEAVMKARALMGESALCQRSPGWRLASGQ